MMANLVETPPESEEELWQHIQEAVEAIQHPQLKETVQRVLEELGERFRTCPAAVSMHHAYYNGLLEHTTHMVRAARALLPLYPEVDHDLAIAGIILHDMGKLEEYEGEFAAKVSRIGTLQGHVVIGFRIARKAALQSKLNADLTERLEHIILSHQGEKEWGAAAMAATPEAVFVSMVDNLDAKMEWFSVFCAIRRKAKPSPIILQACKPAYWLHLRIRAERAIHRDDAPLSTRPLGSLGRIPPGSRTASSSPMEGSLGPRGWIFRCKPGSG